ncbi:YggS family pyridoxal phosphate-dependent enzyme [Adhaeribacter sp. BT258]|uniref:Pyridoxal phosphate homeostasis protein n=1 Tax=Adhaeribacter terrigena TaxID=2793070 RepID=A0ABS1C7Y6_9BACT|nr:YggS family pyridoxal phosphate-dependent enzyme [Adhaeribacter terrigena]MBK0404705.1 YggS family pyridoxal phosphate-dependent enzyme [Adhaeribacter terrigena]
MTIAESVAFFNQKLEGTNCRLVAVSKTHPESLIQEAYDAGQRIFGENKAQEMTAKHENLPQDIEWHMIGHLQTNKVKYIAPFVHTIQSVDSLKLLQEIEKQAAKNNRVINCLLQIYIADEESKFGLSEAEAIEILESESYKNMQHVQISGVMGIATNTKNQQQLRKEFTALKNTFEKLKQNFFPENDTVFKEISMGMSSDYELAIECGSTFIRVGSAIFGNRDYGKM